MAIQKKDVSMRHLWLPNRILDKVREQALRECEADVSIIRRILNEYYDKKDAEKGAKQ